MMTVIQTQGLTKDSGSGRDGLAEGKIANQFEQSDRLELLR